MVSWRTGKLISIKFGFIPSIRLKKIYLQRYEKILMRWGSSLFWIYFLQCTTGILLSLAYIFSFDTGLPSVVHLWWETSHGSLLVRLHSEFGNLVFMFLYGHIFIKLWTSVDASDSDSYITWLSGVFVFICTYIVGVTGAIIPCSILSEVTATITGSAISSIIYIKFDFLETVLVPGMSLNEESIWRTYVIHATVPLVTLLLGIFHMTSLHQNKYSAAGGFKRLGLVPRMRETRRWCYMNRYWSRSFGTWYRVIFIIFFIRFSADMFWPSCMVVVYSFSNFDYWPITETIDFVLAIPHWYLRPLMGVLVTIPHHYLGFIYIGCFFIFVGLIPWLNERNDDDVWGFGDVVDSEGWVTSRWDTMNSLFFLIFFYSVAFTVSIVPTGKYFIALGAIDGLVIGYWVVVLYILVLARLGFYISRFFFFIFKML